MKVVNYVRLLLLGMWLGAAVFFSAVVAPSAFGVLRGNHIVNAGELAGAIVNRNLAVINLSGFVIGLILLLAGVIKFREVTLPLFIIEMLCFAAMTLATAVGNWVIAAKLQALRLTLSGPIEQLAASDPARVSFDALHSYSVKALSVAIIAAFIGFIIVVLRARRSAH